MLIGSDPFSLAGLELVRVQVMSRQQLVEIRAIALREPRRLADVAHRDLQNLRQVITSEFVTCIAERQQLAGVFTE